MHVIETARLILRPYTANDLDDLFLIRSDPEVMRYVRDGKPLTWEETQANLDNIIQHYHQHDFGLWAAVDKANGNLIGYCGLIYLDSTPEVEVGYMLAKAYWGKGLASEGAKACLKYGFEQLKLSRIVAIAKPPNLASGRVMEKIGMKYEKQAFYYNTDVVYYAILQETFQPDDSLYVLRNQSQ